MIMRPLESDLQHFISYSNPELLFIHVLFVLSSLLSPIFYLQTLCKTQLTSDEL